ncbi:MAG: DUF6152 family protein [Pseudomonadota bacterium]
MKFAPLHVVSAAVLTCFSAPAWVHHSGAMFDATKEATVTGTITEFNWTNPHSSFKVSVPNSDGKEDIWAIEMNSPQNLVPQGWKRTTLKAGDKVTVTVRPLRDGKPGGSYMAIVLADGTKLSGNGPSQYNAGAGAPPATAAPAKP